MTASVQKIWAPDPRWSWPTPDLATKSPREILASEIAETQSLIFNDNRH